MRHFPDVTCNMLNVAHTSHASDFLRVPPIQWHATEFAASFGLGDVKPGSKLKFGPGWRHMITSHPGNIPGGTPITAPCMLELQIKYNKCQLMHRSLRNLFIYNPGIANARDSAEFSPLT